MKESLLHIEDLSIRFQTDEGSLLAVDGISFDVYPNEVLGLVGESGCGKSVTAMSILSLIPDPPGRISAKSIRFNGREIFGLPSEELRKIRGKSISMIFQDPMTALSPLRTIGSQLAETARIHNPMSDAEARELAISWLKKTGIPDPAQRVASYPYELSGGMQQRVMIAMALLNQPELVIADEPTTALDVTISAQIFDLLKTMRREKSSILLITHDLGVVWETCDRLIVMYAGKIVEKADKKTLFSQPAHPYTQGLLASVPDLSQSSTPPSGITGQVPSPLAYPKGCRFNDRCPKAMPICKDREPALYHVGNNQHSACFLVQGHSKE